MRCGVGDGEGDGGNDRGKGGDRDGRGNRCSGESGGEGGGGLGVARAALEGQQCQQWWSARTAVEARTIRRSAVARATEKAVAETTAASVVARSAPARAPFSQCAILTVDVLKRPENYLRKDDDKEAEKVTTG